MLPLFQFPNIAAWRNDALEGDTPGGGAENYHGFAYNMHEWQPIEGDEVTIGAEQWPDCINPITDCANSSWAVWLASFAALPALWDPTNDGGYAPTALLASEPVAQVG